MVKQTISLKIPRLVFASFTTSFLAFDNFKVLYSLIYFVDNDNILTAWNNYVYVVCFKNYLSPLRSPLNAKNGCKLGCKVAEESVSKYTLFSTKFLRCAIETLKKVKTKGKHLDEITNSLNLGK